MSSLEHVVGLKPIVERVWERNGPLGTPEEKPELADGDTQILDCVPASVCVRAYVCGMQERTDVHVRVHACARASACVYVWICLRAGVCTVSPARRS